MTHHKLIELPERLLERTKLSKRTITILFTLASVGLLVFIFLSSWSAVKTTSFGILDSQWEALFRTIQSWLWPILIILYVAIFLDVFILKALWRSALFERVVLITFLLLAFMIPILFLLSENIYVPWERLAAACTGEFVGSVAFLVSVSFTLKVLAELNKQKAKETGDSQQEKQCSCAEEGKQENIKSQINRVVNQPNADEKYE